MPKKRKKLGLALGAGGAKGLAHIGVLKVLQKHNIIPDFIAGTSMGAIIGAAYAAGHSPEDIEILVKKTDWKKIIDFTIPKSGILETEMIEKKIEDIVYYKNFYQLKIPLRIIAYNLTKKELVVFSKGSVAQAIRASMSIPGIFPPLELDNQLYVDGAVADPTPFDVVKEMGADIIIAIDLYTPEKTISKSAGKRKSFMDQMKEKFVIVELLNVKNYLFPYRWPHFIRRLGGWLFDKIVYPARVMRIITKRELPTLTKVMYDAISVLTNNLAREKIEHSNADIILRPTFRGMSWSDFDKVDKMIRIGEKAMEDEMGKLKRKLKN